MESNLSILSCVASAFSSRHQDMTCRPTHSALFLPLLFLPSPHSPLETLASPCPSSTQGPFPPKELHYSAWAAQKSTGDSRAEINNNLFSQGLGGWTYLMKLSAGLDLLEVLRRNLFQACLQVSGDCQQPFACLGL